MAFLSEFIKSLPLIISALIELKKYWDTQFEIQQRKNKMAEFKEAVKVARENKDSKTIEQFFNELSRK